MKSIASILLTASLIISTQASNADTITDTYATGNTLTAGTLNNIKSAVNGNDTNITGNTSNISNNAADIAANALAVSTSSTSAATNAASITSNLLGINSNAVGVATNALGIITNAGNINTNASGIANNTVKTTSNASNISTNFNNISNNNNRLAAVEAVTTVPADFTGFGLTFSAEGNPKNVAIVRSLNSDGTTNYYIRSRYANSAEQISVQGVNTTRPFIANYGFVVVDSAGNLTSISNYIEAPLTEAYEDYLIEQSSFDTTSLAKTVTVDTGSETWICGAKVGVIEVCNINVKVTGASVRDFETARVMELLGAGEIGGIAFTNMRGSQRSYDGSAWYEVRAKGIGRILKMNRNRAVEKIIYYRVDGNTGGSLTGTPFASGQLLENFLY